MTNQPTISIKSVDSWQLATASLAAGNWRLLLGKLPTGNWQRGLLLFRPSVLRAGWAGASHITYDAVGGVGAKNKFHARALGGGGTINIKILQFQFGLQIML